MRNPEKSPGMSLLLVLLLFLLLLFTFLARPEQRIRKVLKKAGLNDNQIRIVIAQAKVESGNFSSPVYRRNKNCFGMRDAKIRPENSLNDFDADGYANYNNIEQSVKDYLLWIEYNHLTISEDPLQWAALLKQKKYFQSNTVEYGEAIKSWMI